MKKVDFMLDAFSLISALLASIAAWLAVCFVLEGGRGADPSAGRFFQDLSVWWAFVGTFWCWQWQSFDQLKQLIRTGGVVVNFMSTAMYRIHSGNT